ncbi:hypothetical protein [Verrucomicrobium sp. BvORR106]|uniref:hypothetical protein n=1 Tax=Verrucomicrobium sp. BvORR106 TaxID=1403819 RepID=UPI0005707B79|nr:hypothetical protein [Verrucomicrobium sp. BvORR106]
MTPRCICFLWLLTLLVGCRQEKPKTAERVPGAELQVVATRVAISKKKLPADILPYDDSLVWHEYAVKKVIYGTCDVPKIRVAHWSVAAAKAVPVNENLEEEVTLNLRPFAEKQELQDVSQSDDLDVTEDLPKYLDMTPLPKGKEAPLVLREDYGGFFSEQMRLYWKLRPQLRVVAMGNSLVTKGISTRMFYRQINQGTPVALNLAPAGANNAMQCLVVREYVLPLPKLEWVVWGVSPRGFNAKREDPRKLSEFLASPGWHYDQENKAKLWPVPAATTPVTVDEVRQLNVHNFDDWGWEGRKRGGMPDATEPEKLHAYINETFKTANFEWSEERWTEFVETVKALNAKGVKVLLLVTPMHPWVKDAPAADPDWSTHEAMMQMVQRLEKLDQELPLSWFQDFNKGGNHDFPPDEFYDADHVNRNGSFKLTGRVVEWMDSVSGKR